MSKHINYLILQHGELEDSGYIKKLMENDLCEVTTVKLYRGDRIPSNLNRYDAMLCLSGAMDTWMVDDFPWIMHEKERIYEFVLTLEKPFFGFCFGAQLLGEVLGGNVRKLPRPEVGISDVNLKNRIKSDILTGKMPLTFKTIQWHSYEVQGIEKMPNTRVLASSFITRNQLFRYKEYAYGIQFHIETTEEMLYNWHNLPEYKIALQEAHGTDAWVKINKQAFDSMYEMHQNCEIFYDNIKRVILHHRNNKKNT